MSIRVYEDNGNLVVEKNGRIEVVEDFRLSDILLHFLEEDEFAKDDSLTKIFEDIPKNKVLKAIETIEAGALVFMNKEELRDLKDTYQNLDTSSMELIKEYD